MKMPSILLLNLFGLLCVADARSVTLIVATNLQTRDIQISAGEVAELIGWSSFSSLSATPFRIILFKDDLQMDLSVPPSVTFYSGGVAVYPSRQVIAGPAMVRLLKEPVGGPPVFCTFNIAPEAFPPDKTVIIPAGTNQVAVTMECSTNLLNWVTATNGVYGSQPGAKFFRIRAEAIN